LDKWDLEDGDERSMLSKLEESYKKQEPIIITAWKPHWVFDEMDLKMLDDPDKMYSGDDEHINLVFNKKFEKEHPAAHKIATRMAEDWSKEDEEKAMKRIFVDGDDGQKVAEDFVDDHSHTVDKWKKKIAEDKGRKKRKRSEEIRRKKKNGKRRNRFCVMGAAEKKEQKDSLKKIVIKVKK